MDTRRYVVVAECGASTPAPVSSRPVSAGVAVLLFGEGLFVLHRKRAVSAPLR